MIPEIIALIAFLAENCTGIVLTRSYENSQPELQEPLTSSSATDSLEDFTRFDPNDCVFQEYDPPTRHHDEDGQEDPKAWRKSLPPLKTSLKKCFQTVLLIQIVAGGIVGLLVVGIVFLDFVFAEWCYDMNDKWNDMPKKVQTLRVTTQAIKGGLIELWVFTCIMAVFPFSLIKDLHLLTLNVLAAFIDMSYRLYLQVIGMYGASWKSFPMNTLFTCVILTNNYLLARHFYPRSLRNTIKLDFILSSQFLLGLPAAFVLIYVVLPWYFEQDEHIKVIIASCSPLLTAIPKVVSRIGVQTLYGIVHPGTANALVASLYAGSAVVFRVMQSELNSFSYFIALGIAHALIDLLERVTVTMRDHIWEYLYRLVKRQQRQMPKYRSPRSRRFIADLSIQIMLHEATTLVNVLGFNTIYQILYTHEKPLFDYKIVIGFFNRATAGLFIDLVFNTISVLIQTRVMNIAVCRVWRKKWRYHVVVNALLVSISVLYFSGYLLVIVKDKYPNSHYPKNCSYPSFL